MYTNIRYYFIAVVLIVITGICFTVFANEDAIGAFLRSYGYEVSAKPIEHAEFTIPSPLDEVYKSYNEIQLKAGFDLRPYEGRSGVRYTYEVKNYPGNVKDVRANVLVVGGEIIGGDICTLRLDGFMHELGG